MHMAEFDDLLELLRLRGGDTAAVEVKSAAGGLPASLTKSLSALSNLPGGGVVILGLDERQGFAPVGLGNIQALKQGLAGKARSLTPPAQLDITDELVDGVVVIVARVAECTPSDKPCRVTSTRKAYLRSHDGDFQLSELEEQGFLRARSSKRRSRAGAGHHRRRSRPRPTRCVGRASAGSKAGDCCIHWCRTPSQGRNHHRHR